MELMWQTLQVINSTALQQTSKNFVHTYHLHVPHTSTLMLEQHKPEITILTINLSSVLQLLYEDSYDTKKQCLEITVQTLNLS